MSARLSAAAPPAAAPAQVLQASAAPALVLRAAAALAGSREPAQLAALLGWPLHAVQVALAGPPDGEVQPVEVNPDAQAPDALAPVVAWYGQAPEAAAAAVARALAWHLGAGRVAQAAPIALAFGSPAQRLALLEQAGWLLLWRPARALLGRLLDSVAMEPAAEAGEVLALRLAWCIEVERLPHVAERRLQQGPALPVALQAAFRSRIAQVFDDARSALRLAREAVAGHPNDLQPAALFARYALGFALLDAGQPREALPALADVVRASARDGLPLLTLDALALQARAHEELAELPALRATLAAARGLVTTLEAGAPTLAAGLRSLPARRGLERLRRGLALRCPDLARADVPPAASGAATEPPWADGPPLADDAPPEAYDAFPGLVQDTLAWLQAGALDRAAEPLAALERRLAGAFHCAKWRHQHRHARLWWLARRPDAAALAAMLADAVPPAGPAATLVELHQAVLHAAAAALAGRPLPAPALQALADTLAARSLALLQRRLLLVRVIAQAEAGADAAALLQWLECAADGQWQDALWLAPKLAAPLAALLGSVAIVRHPAARGRAQQLLQWMLAQPAPAATGTAPTAASAPPADLTQREWEILQLIGQHYTNEQIAARLNVSLATVKTHINRVYGKLAIGSRAEAVQRAHHLA